MFSLNFNNPKIYLCKDKKNKLSKKFILKFAKISISNLMKKIYLLFAFALMSISAIYAQSNLKREYVYDDSGNRTVRKVLTLKSMKMDYDSTATEDDSIIENLPEESHYVEKMGNIQLNIFPNPTSEMVTVRIENSNDFKDGTLRLYMPNGQLLREYPVNSPEFTIDLSNYVKGVYLLNLQINQHSDTWKIIKQ